MEDAVDEGDGHLWLYINAQTLRLPSVALTFHCPRSQRRVRIGCTTPKFMAALVLDPADAWKLGGKLPAQDTEII